MSLVSIELFKAHVRADDFSADDAYLEHLLNVSEEYVCKAVNRSAEELTEMGGGSLPVTLQHAVMLVGGHWYEHRSGVDTGQMAEVPYTIQALLKPYTKLVADESGEDA